MNQDCILHEEKLNSLEKNMAIIGTQLTQLLDKDSDFIVKVINGKTTERLASELIGEMYLNMKELQKHTIANSFFSLSKFASAAMPILFIIAIILMFLGYEHLATQITQITK